MSEEYRTTRDSPDPRLRTHQEALMLKEFKDFIMRGNVVDLAVAVIVGAAFTAVVNSFANDILMQLVAAVFGKPDFNGLTFELGDAIIRYGAFITVLINFLIVAFVVFLVVKGINKLQHLRTKQEEEELEETEVELLAQIRDALVRQQT
jgi:large conductance mechanosensitive channel